jgi:hypothetical protein
MSESDDTGWRPRQNPTETNAEYKARTGYDVDVPVPVSKKPARSPHAIGGSEWALGIGGPVFLVLGWIIAGVAGESARHEAAVAGYSAILSGSFDSGSSSLTSALGWQTFGGMLSWLGVALIVILLSIRAAVNTYLRHRERA